MMKHKGNYGQLHDAHIFSFREMKTKDNGNGADELLVKEMKTKDNGNSINRLPKKELQDLCRKHGSSPNYLIRTSGGGTGEGHHLGGGVSRGERHKGETVVATEVAVTPEVDMVAAFVRAFEEAEGAIIPWREKEREA
uniref:Uncharacterized protein n=1 Tax=Solanum lycopersicum TaxID=4081 RepID=A0A3Q7GIE4_SOLLC